MRAERRFGARAIFCGRLGRLAGAGLLCSGLLGCGQGTGTAPPPTPAPDSLLVPTASIQDLMAAEVDPAADFLWESVATIVTAAGTEEHQPRTEDEWREVRHRAITLIEAGNLLIMDGRRAAAPGRALEDEGAEGNYTAAQVDQAIERNRPIFVGFAQSLRQVGTQMLAAIDAKDPGGMLEVGSALDEVCEGCHMVFWYPGQVLPELREPGTPGARARPRPGTPRAGEH